MEVIGGKLGVKAESDVGLIGGAGLSVGAGGLDGAADAAPEIRLPTGLGGKHEIVIGGGFAGCVGGAVLRDMFARDGGSGRERGEERGARRCDLIAGSEIALQRLTERGVIDGDALFKLVELGIVVDLPPVAAEEAVRRIGGLPCAAIGSGRWKDYRRCAGFLVGGRGLVGGTAVVGAGGLAGGENEGKELRGRQGLRIRYKSVKRAVSSENNSGAGAPRDFAGFMYGLKPVPCNASSFPQPVKPRESRHPGTTEVVP